MSSVKSESQCFLFRCIDFYFVAILPFPSKRQFVQLAGNSIWSQGNVTGNIFAQLIHVGQKQYYRSCDIAASENYKTRWQVKFPATFSKASIFLFFFRGAWQWNARVSFLYPHASTRGLTAFVSFTDWASLYVARFNVFFLDCRPRKIQVLTFQNKGRLVGRLSVLWSVALSLASHLKLCVSWDSINIFKCLRMPN